MSHKNIVLKKVSVHNLKEVNLTLPEKKLIVFTGVSGSGKSSLAFDTLYVEGQRRFIESLSPYVRKQMEGLQKPDMESAVGITPTVSIEQKTAGKNPRSTVGTLTEIHDYLRILFARLATAYCPVSKEPLSFQSKEEMIHTLLKIPGNRKALLFAPLFQDKKGEFKEEFEELLKKGFVKAKLDNEIISLESPPELDPQKGHDLLLLIDRFEISNDNRTRLMEAITLGLQEGKGQIAVSLLDPEEELFFSSFAFSKKSGISYSPLEPNDFSFNSPHGMCPTCLGLGTTKQFILEKIIDNEKSIEEDPCLIASSYNTVRYGNIYDNLARIYGFSVKTPWKKLSEEAKKVFLYGTEKKWTRMLFKHPETEKTWFDHIEWKGVLYEALRRYSEAKSALFQSKMEAYMEEALCPACQGAKIKPYPAAALFRKETLHSLSKKPVVDLLSFFESVKMNKEEEMVGLEVIREIIRRLTFLKEVGLTYLSLERTAPTLSGGEAQRVRLASQVGSGLVGITYILDEPSIGLHPIDNKKLIRTLRNLQEAGNTVIVVEHDEETIEAADFVVDFGPKSGRYGGEIVYAGTLPEFITAKNSLTASYFRGDLSIPIPKKRRKKGKESLKILGASHHNLKNLNVEIPLNLFVSIVGVSGSGKSSLISDILYPALSNKLMKSALKEGKYTAIEGIEYLDKVIEIDQSPIGRNPRSNPATYIKVWDDIRDLFASLKESKAKGFEKGRFSFNVQEGSCLECGGMGMQKVDMDFLEDAWTKCPACLGKRFDEETLSIYFKGKNIFDILSMEVREALEFFSAIPSIQKRLSTLDKVGLGYIQLGQSSTTLSGGEAQRVKLAKELSRPSTENTLYILDEPTTGLHIDDIKKLLDVLHALVEQGKSILVIEHHMDVVKTSDYVIELGPVGGDGGGKVVASGTPEKVAASLTPTGIALKESLELDRKKRASSLAKKEQKPSLSLPLIHSIEVVEAEEHNLKKVSATLPREAITAIIGPSGSGKSSFAIDTLYAEGQRRYVESLSPYARQFVEALSKPKVKEIKGLSPSIAIEQKKLAGNPRSTIGTMTEIHDFLRVLYAKKGVPYCPETGEKIESITKEWVATKILEFPLGTKLHIFAPLVLKKGESLQIGLERMLQNGFLRVKSENKLEEIETLLEKNEDLKKKNNFLLLIDRIVLQDTSKNRLLEAIEKASSMGNQEIYIEKEEEMLFFNLAFAVPSTGKSYREITPHTFSFNAPQGMCLECEGLGIQYGANLLDAASLWDYSVEELLKDLFEGSYNKKAFSLFEALFKKEKINIKVPLNMLSPSAISFILYGDKNTFIETKEKFAMRWMGVYKALELAAKHGKREIRYVLMPLMTKEPCVLCKGERLNPLARNVLLNHISLPALSKLSIEEAFLFLKNVSFTKEEEKLFSEVIKELHSRFQFLTDVGLGYLSLERTAPTLSGGETQRIRLARQLGSGLKGIMYVLDEPSSGLHPKDIVSLTQALLHLKELGNTLILIEHDLQTMKIADHFLDFGPKAGPNGGYITASGTLQQILDSKTSVTGPYLSGAKKSFLPTEKKAFKKPDAHIHIENASLHNLKNLSLKIPIQSFTVLTGVSGSGKSTLLEDFLYPLAHQAVFEKEEDSASSPHGKVSGLASFSQVVFIDQNPVGLTARSDVSTFSEIAPKLRLFFASLKESLLRGLQPKNFSTNHLKGMCTHCFGMGYKKVDMLFLPSVQLPCKECHGFRLNPLSLEVLYKGKNYGQILQMTIDEALSFFENISKLTKPLTALKEVGLSYIPLGALTQTLSSGESARLKLGFELGKRRQGKTLFLLDEPSSGLHPQDISLLLQVFQSLQKKGHTLIASEHHLDIIQFADHIIELGPKAGALGGHLLFEGSLSALKKCKDSNTAPFL